MKNNCAEEWLCSVLLRFLHLKMAQTPPTLPSCRCLLSLISFWYNSTSDTTIISQVSKRCLEVWKVAGKTLRWNVLFFFDAHAVLFTVRIWGASCYETRRVNGIALILVIILVPIVAEFGKWVQDEVEVSEYTFGFSGTSQPTHDLPARIEPRSSRSFKSSARTSEELLNDIVTFGLEQVWTPTHSKLSLLFHNRCDGAFEQSEA